MATKIIIDADVNSLISQIDKAAARFEKFSNAGSDSIDEVSASYDKLTEKEKRAFDASKKQFNEKVASMQKLEKEYEALRSKQEQGIKLSQDECKRLRDINKEYKTLANATRQISNEMSGLAKDLKKAATAENQLRTRTPQVTHKFADLKAETLALAAALGLGADAFVSMGLEADKQLQKLNAMLGSTEAATKAYYEMADAQRYLGIDSDVFNEYYAKLTKVTGSAQTAAHHLKLMGDAAANAGMLTGQFDQLVDQLEIIKANGFFTDTNIEMLEELGLTDVKKELESAFGVPYEMISKSNGDQVYNAIISWFERAFAGTREIQNDSITGIFTEIAHDVGQIAHEIGKVFLDDFGLRKFFKSFSDGSQKFVEELRKMNYGVQSFREAMNNTFGETAVDTGYTAMYGAIGYGATEAATSLWGLVQASSGFEKVKKELTKGNKYKEFDFLVTKAIAAKKALDNFSKDKKATGDVVEPDQLLWAKQTREELKDVINLNKTQEIDLKAANNLLANHERLNKEYEAAVDNVNNLRQSVIKLAKEIRSSSEDEYCLVPIELLNEEKNYIKAISESRKKDADATLKHAKVVKDATEEKVTSLKKSYASFKESITSTFTKSSAAIKKYKIDTVGAAADVGGTLADLAGTTNKNMSRMGFFAAWKQGFIALGAAAKACFAAILTPITGITIVIAALAKLADNLYDKYKDADFGSLLEHAMRGEDLPESEAVKQALEGLKAKEKEVQFQKTLNKLSYNSQGLMDAHNKELNKKISRTNQLAKVSEEAAKAAEKQRKEEYAFAKENLARDQYAENYSLALAAKANAEKLNNDIEYYANLESLMQGFGATEKSLDAQRLKNKKQLAKDLFEVENNYATQLKSLQDRLALKNLDLSNASTDNEKSLIKKDIEQIENEIANLNFNHVDNIIEIEVRANVSQLNNDLQEAVRKQSEKNSGLNINPRYQEALSASISNFQTNSTKLAQAYTTEIGRAHV